MPALVILFRLITLPRTRSAPTRQPRSLTPIEQLLNHTFSLSLNPLRGTTEYSPSPLYLFSLYRRGERGNPWFPEVENMRVCYTTSQPQQSLVQCRKRLLNRLAPGYHKFAPFRSAMARKPGGFQDSRSPSPQSGPQARQKNYEWISGICSLTLRSSRCYSSIRGSYHITLNKSCYPGLATL
jgi:hypothetical protein